MTANKSRHAKILQQLNELSFALDVYSKVPAMIAVYNINSGEYIYVNESVTQLLGYSPDEFIKGGLSFVSSLVHPDDMQTIIAGNTSALKKANSKSLPGKRESIATFEYRLKHKNGSWRWLHSDGTVFDRDKNGKVLHVMNVSVDITERRKAEDKAKLALETEIIERSKKEKELADAQALITASEERYTAFVRNSHEGIWRFELEKPISTKLPPSQQIKMMYQYGYLAEANEAMARMYGIDSPKDLLGARLGDLLIQDEPDNIAYLRAFIRSGYSLGGFESHEKDKQGNKKVFRNSLVGEVIDGRLVRAWGTQQDVTQEYQYKKQLQRNEEHLGLAMRAAAMGSWEWNLEKGAFVWSDELRSIYGLAKDIQLNYESIRQQTHPEDMARVSEATQNALKSGKPYEVEYRIVWPDGSIHWVAAYGQAIRQKSKPVRMFGTLRNIDDQKSREEKLSMAVSAGKVATWDWDLISGHIERSNEYYRLLGIDSLNGDLNSYLSLIHPEDREKVLAEVKESIKNRKYFEITYRIVKPTGTIRWLTDRGKIYRNSKAKAVAIRGTCIDITEIKNYANALQQNEERLALALDASHMGIWEWNLESGELTWSDQLKSLYGLATTEYIDYDRFISLVHPEDMPILQETINNALKSGKSYEIEHRVIWPDSSIHWLQGKGKAHLRQKKAYRMIGTSVNIDLQKAADLRLKESETKFRQLFNNAPDGIMVTTVNGKIIETNNAASTLLGYTGVDFSKIKLHRLLHAKDILKIKRLQKSSSENTEYVTELSLRHKKGHFILTEITARLLSDGTWLTFIRDISERQQQEAAIHETRIKEKILQERAQLLSQQHHQITLLNKAKDEFLSVASHHLRTPVTAVKTYLAMLREGYAGKLNKDQMAFLEQAFDSNEQQLQVIDDILNVAEIDTDKVVMQLKKTNITKLTKEIILSLESKFIARKQKVRFKSDPSNISAKIDRVKFRLVLENLVGNASKYSPDNTQVRVDIKQLKRTVRISVTDEGKGISPRDVPKIFEKFARVRNQAYQSERGTGLGLYWAKRIVELHGGNISVKSKENVGSTFTVTLPIES
jgi:PAS domain S-box-containing protein